MIPHGGVQIGILHRRAVVVNCGVTLIGSRSNGGIIGNRAVRKDGEDLIRNVFVALGGGVRVVTGVVHGLVLKQRSGQVIADQRGLTDISHEELAFIFHFHRLANGIVAEVIAGLRDVAQKRAGDVDLLRNGESADLDRVTRGGGKRQEVCSALARDQLKGLEAVEAGGGGNDGVRIQLEQGIHGGGEVCAEFREVGHQELDPADDPVGDLIRIQSPCGKECFHVAQDRRPGAVLCQLFLQRHTGISAQRSAVFGDLVDQSDGAFPGIVQTDIHRDQVCLGSCFAELRSPFIQDLLVECSRGQVVDLAGVQQMSAVIGVIKQITQSLGAQAGNGIRIQRIRVYVFCKYIGIAAFDAVPHMDQFTVCVVLRLAEAGSDGVAQTKVGTVLSDCFRCGSKDAAADTQAHHQNKQKTD